MTVICLMIHGETDLNAQERLLGQANIEGYLKYMGYVGLRLR